MREHAGGLSLSKQPLAQPLPFRVVGKIRQTNGFNGDNPADGGILGAINHPGRSTAELVQNPVSADLIHADTAILSGRPNPAPSLIFRDPPSRLRVCLTSLSMVAPFLTIIDDVRITEQAMSTDATLGSKGQTTIPKPIRDSLRMKAGDKMSFTLMPDGLVIMRMKNRQVSDLAGLLYKKGKKPVPIELLSR